jgi:hypothetical protein
VADSLFFFFLLSVPRQPDTDSFKVPGDIETRTKEINNGRLAMVSILGTWVGELLTVSGLLPYDV